MFFRRNKKLGKKKTSLNAEEVEEELKSCADNFLNKNNVHIIQKGVKVKIPAIKWLYPGYQEYRAHAIVPNIVAKIATEIINDQDFVNDFLHNKRDVDGAFGYFVARVEGNYVMMSINGSKIFASIKESDMDDYDIIVLMKQCNRLFPKFNKETFQIDFKHIEIFGEVFNKLKVKFSASYPNLSEEQLRIMHIDIPSYTQSSIKIESSFESYNILKLSEVLESVSYNVGSVAAKDFRTVIENNINGIEKVKDVLHISENSKRFSMAIENLEKITNKLEEIRRLHNALTIRDL